MLPVWENELTEEEVEAMVERAATEISRRGLETVAILFLEMHKPLANVIAHGALAFSPFMMPFLGFDRVDRFTQFLSKPANVEKLIQRIEELRDRRTSKETEVHG
jgi:cytosine/adenosine deaminase-related metal-dependent hydrolase